MSIEHLLFFQFFILTALVAVARGGVIGAPGAVVAAPVLARLSDATIDPNPAYSYAYDVQDALTGDSKSQVESRANNIVRGQYTVADPDGTRRIVDYYADPVHGFNAVVRKVPLGAPLVAPVARAIAPVAPVAHVAPVARAVAAPAVLPAPVARISAPLGSPVLAAPGFARVAAPYVGAPAPLAVAPGHASPYYPYASPYAVL
ncbi:unnamed protein product [Phaedon cochleariae]|uniref:Larval cuticle protein A2B n=1 Tax=Phaedon cochleariae TaxID=80249 RepID=A0A9N9X4F0_PHACE|nr:unnamed protein product [Phaedon cochleariae]